MVLLIAWIIPMREIATKRNAIETDVSIVRKKANVPEERMHNGKVSN